MTQVNSLFVNDISRHNHNIIVLYIDIIDDPYLLPIFLSIQSVPLYTDYIRLRDHIQWWYSKWRLECEFEDLSGPIRCKIGIWYFSTMNTALRRKSRNWLMWNQDNLSKWYNMSTCGSMFLWASTTCLSSTDIISSNCNIKQQHSLKVKVEGHISKYCILWWWTTIFVTRHYKIKSKKYIRYYIFDFTKHILYQVTFMNKWNIKSMSKFKIEVRRTSLINI